MAEVTLPGEELTPEVPVVVLEKPGINSKVIEVIFDPLNTKKTTVINTSESFFTTDTDAWLEFTATGLTDATGTYSLVLRNRNDGSVFQHVGDMVDGKAYYKIPVQEIRHAGRWVAQMYATLENGDSTGAQFGFSVEGHLLDGADVREVVVEDFKALMAQLEAIKGQAETDLTSLKADLSLSTTEAQQLITDTNKLKLVYDELLETGVLQTNINEKLTELETTYAPRLTTLEQNDVSLTAQLQQTQADFRDAVSKVTVDSEVILARTGVTGIVHTTLDERLDFMERTAIDNDGLIFGVAWDKSANPTLTRTDSAIGMVANVGKDNELVQNDFDSVPIYRDIEDMTDANGNEFVKIPKFYIQKTEDASTMRIRISKTRYPGFYLPKVFWDFENSKELDYYLHGKYKASISADGTKLESKFGEYPLINRNIVQFRTLAQANNTLEANGYQQLDIHAQDVISVLFTIEFATLHSQSVMQGYTTGRYTNNDLATVAEVATNRFILPNATADQYRIGQTISLGTSQGGNQIAYGRTITAIEVYDVSNKAIVFDGAPVDIAIGNNIYNTGWKNGFSKAIAASSGCVGANDGKYPCSYRGIESPWGDLWQWVDGVNINDNQTWVAMDAEKYASNVFSDPYNKIGYVNSTENGYPKKMGFDPQFPFANLAVEMGAGSSTYYADYYYQASGQRVARVGGLWYDGSRAGLWYWALVSSSGNAYVDVGGRLLKKAL